MKIFKIRKINSKEYHDHLGSINKNGYTIVRNFFSKKAMDYLLKLTKKNFKYINEKKIKTPKVWNTAKIIYNLQNKSSDYINLLNNNFFENILKSKLNDPHYRSDNSDQPNYVLNNYIARSSGKGPLFLHIDSGIPTGEVTTFIQMMIPLEKVTKEKGCTVVVPKSHLSKKFSDRKTKKFKNIYGNPGDIFIWDGNLWHGSLPNTTRQNTRWSLIATFSNWQFKQVFDIPRGLPQKIFNQLSLKQKMLLGYCGIPAYNEYERVPRSIPVSKLRKKVKDFYKIPQL